MAENRPAFLVKREVSSGSDLTPVRSFQCQSQIKKTKRKGHLDLFAATVSSCGILSKAWNKRCHRLWAYIRRVDREVFVEQIMRSRCKAPTDVHDLIKRVLNGRSRVEKQALYAYARSLGLSVKAVRKATKELGLETRRSGRFDPAAWFFKNPARDYKNQLIQIPTDDLKAAKKRFYGSKEPLINRWDNHRPSVKQEAPTAGLFLYRTSVLCGPHQSGKRPAPTLGRNPGRTVDC
jgi:hypothetical protein